MTNPNISQAVGVDLSKLTITFDTKNMNLSPDLLGGITTPDPEFEPDLQLSVDLGPSAASDRAWVGFQTRKAAEQAAATTDVLETGGDAGWAEFQRQAKERGEQ